MKNNNSELTALSNEFNIYFRLQVPIFLNEYSKMFQKLSNNLYINNLKNKQILIELRR